MTLNIGIVNQENSRQEQNNEKSVNSEHTLSNGIPLNVLLVWTLQLEWAKMKFELMMGIGENQRTHLKSLSVPMKRLDSEDIILKILLALLSELKDTKEFYDQNEIL